MAYNDAIDAISLTTTRLVELQGRTIGTGPKEGGTKNGDDLYSMLTTLNDEVAALVTKLNMEKVVTLTFGGSGTSTAFTFSALSLPDMEDTSFYVVGLDESNLVSLKATDGFTVAHQTDSTDVVDVKIIGNWDE